MLRRKNSESALPKKKVLSVGSVSPLQVQIKPEMLRNSSAFKEPRASLPVVNVSDDSITPLRSCSNPISRSVKNKSQSSPGFPKLLISQPGDTINLGLIDNSSPRVKKKGQIWFDDQRGQAIRCSSPREADDLKVKTYLLSRDESYTKLTNLISY